jgi:hypothetical protein
MARGRLSFGAIAIETLVIVGVGPAPIAIAHRGGAVLCLLLGFVVAGPLLAAWWIPLLSFLPWHLVRHRRYPQFTTMHPMSAARDRDLSRRWPSSW